MNDTPFRISGRVVGEQFFGRTETIRTVVQHLRGKSNVALLGAPRAGKTSLLTVLFRNYRHAERDAQTWFIDLRDLHTLDELIAEFYSGMKLTTTNYSLRDFAKQLKLWRQRLVVFIDNGEHFAAPPFNEEAFFAVLATHMQSQTVSLCVASTMPPESVFVNRIGLPLHSYFARCDLPPFSPMECEEFIHKRLQWTGIHFSDAEIMDLIKASGGRPADLQRLAADLFRLKASGNAPSRVQTTSVKK